MSEPIRFMMGKFEALFPTDRCYAKNHMWAQQQGSLWRFGFSAYAVRLLQDVYFLDWDLTPPLQVRQREEIGQIESSKAESALYSPMSGNLNRINEELMNDPSKINVDKYEAGWLFEIEGDGGELLSPEAYLEHLTAAWKLAERAIKGQFND